MACLRRFALTLGIGFTLAGCLGPEPAQAPRPSRDRPNILLVVADDLGYSDLGAYGSEISTPNLDALAESSLVATDFYVAPRGEPTRAMLLTGADNHAAGFGTHRGLTSTNQQGKPGYEGQLSPRVVTVASLLREAGYHTYMAGKWALGGAPESLPSVRGFERSFVLHDSAASYWDDMASAVPQRDRATYTDTGEPVTELSSDYYSTHFMADYLIEAIESQRRDGSPFFAYFAPQAPHGPLSVPTDWLDRYAGRYDSGYDEIRNARLLRMKGKRLVGTDVRPFPGIPTVPPWAELSDEQQRRQARKMELYAALVENLDFHVGRLLDYLKRVGEYEETLIVFLSDSGAEPANRGPNGMGEQDRDWYAEQFPRTEFESWGRKGSFVEYGPAWAQVSAVPFRLFKGTHAEGGIRSPLIVKTPGSHKRTVTRALLHVTDLAPTFLELAAVEYPRSRDGRELAPLRGASLIPLLEGGWSARRGPHEWLGFAYAGGRAIRAGDWKLVWMQRPFGIGEWRLYRLDFDPTELHDRAAARPGRKAELLELWRRYADENGVVLPEADSAGAEAPAGSHQKSSASEML
jgi:arylsulfatase